jgi:two-component system response regulator GlrR
MGTSDQHLLAGAAASSTARVLLVAPLVHPAAAQRLLHASRLHALPGCGVEHRTADLDDDAPPDADLLLLWLDAPAAAPGEAALRRWAAQAPLLLVPARSLGSVPRWLQAGACDFVVQDTGAEELALRLQRALAARSALSMAADVHATPLRGDAQATPLPGMVGRSPAFLRQLDKLAPIARCDAGVLVLGETGTGKEVFAQAVHYTSARAGKPFIALNCGAIPHELIENELFGHVRGAYTTAHAARAGLVREAEGGSLFLDDIDCLPLAAQAKLLRFLQEREYRPVGGNTLQRADVRVIAASNRDLGAMAAAGTFRQDLYYRLNVLCLKLPPLRERAEDIAPLALHFMRRYACRFDKPVHGFTPAALRALMLHDWPGNVRELQHLVERAVLLAAGPVLDAADLDLAAPHAPALESFQASKARVIQHFERRYIETLLSSTQGNVADAARAAGKHRRAFFELIRKHRITPERFRSPVS